MTSTHPQDERTTDSPERRAESTDYRDDRTDDREERTDYRDDRSGYRDERTDYRDDRSSYRDDRRESRGDTMTHRESAGEVRTRKVRETKPAFLTTEFWFAAGGIAALVVIYLVADDPDLDLFRTALLATLIGIAYIVSRGLAKAGSRTTRQPEDPRLVSGHDFR